MSYKSENWKEKLDEVRNYIEPRKEGTVEKTAEQIISDEIDQELSTFFSEDTLPEVEEIEEDILLDKDAIYDWCQSSPINAETKPKRIRKVNCSVR